MLSLDDSSKREQKGQGLVNQTAYLCSKTDAKQYLTVTYGVQSPFNQVDAPDY